MTLDKELIDKISEAVLHTADPERAEINLQRFFEQRSAGKRISPHFMGAAARLFAASQFLANFCIKHPDELHQAFKERKQNITKRLLSERVKRELPSDEEIDMSSAMRALRFIKKRYLLRITLRDVTGEIDVMSSMDELTILAETIISISLRWSLNFITQKFGEPAGNAISLIGLGKLGGEEINYSSDVDLIAVYASDEGQTGGVPNPSGLMFNRISNHEFYCKVVELLGKLLSSQTEDGITYRVDFRLRPQGQKGDIALPLKAYEAYYESWGRTWERMVLIRARPVAGGMDLAAAFIKAIEPFVWKRTIDYAELEEIRGMKKKIDSHFTRDDIKRGYGGIREVEFFIQTFQLLYADAESSLKTYRILNAIQALKWMKIVPEDDLTTLWDNYIYLRRIEHYLQMKEDLQTHTLPSSEADIQALAKNMGYQTKDDFLVHLRVKRMQIKNMYNSLLGTSEDVHAESLHLLEGKLADEELKGYLSFRKVRDEEKCLCNMKNIREHMVSFRTLKERAILREAMPQLLENALTAESPDRALSGLDSLLTTYNIKTVHLTAIMQQKELMRGIIKMFSLSPYLTGIFLSSHYYLDTLIEEWSIITSLKKMEDRLQRAVHGENQHGAIYAKFRRYEEIRSGILFLQNILKTEDLFKGLSQLAEVIIRSNAKRFECGGLSVIALGKLGGREMTFGSDLDIVFVSETSEAMGAAEKMLRALTDYTDMGLLYNVDIRLRPDGTKGILVKDIEGYRNYCFNKAQNWEIQALLKARPVGGNVKLGNSFVAMAKDAILHRGEETEKDEIFAMRERIVKEVSREGEGMDIKHGPGGIEEIEFYVQSLQLQHARQFPDILVQNTLVALNRLRKKGILSPEDRDALYRIYEYYRKLQTFLRLNESNVITEGSYVADLSARFMEHGSQNEFIERVREMRQLVLRLVQGH